MYSPLGKVIVRDFETLLYGQFIFYLEASVHGYSTVSLGPIITVSYIGFVEASRQGYSMGSLGKLITVHYLAM
jgi:hypothetical protein